mgnify:CR=1 FL=1
MTEEYPRPWRIQVWTTVFTRILDANGTYVCQCVAGEADGIVARANEAQIAAVANSDHTKENVDVPENKL